jgi:hypothetical protein
MCLQNALRSYSLVFDAVYTPKITRLLREAEESGAKIVTGLEMFIGQAYEQFERFTELPGKLSGYSLYNYGSLLLSWFIQIYISVIFSSQHPKNSFRRPCQSTRVVVQRQYYIAAGFFFRCGSI